MNLNEQLNELALFAGAGGGILGGKLLGWRTICAVEWEPYPASVLAARQNDRILAPFPIWDDVCTFDGRPWRGRVDVVSGGFPCQDISCAGKGVGIDGERSGMWVEMARIIREVAPRYVFVENSPMLTSRGLGRVLGDLAEMGFNARWGVLGACDVGAPHKRERIWIMANSACLRVEGHELLKSDLLAGPSEDVANTDGLRELQPEGIKQDEWGRTSNGDHADLANSGCKHGQGKSESSNTWHQRDSDNSSDRSWWESEPDVGRVAHGVAFRVDRLKAIGNGQVSSVAALAWRILSEA
jgi:DNA (cytosine-5)-methyltransferase 1